MKNVKHEKNSGYSPIRQADIAAITVPEDINEKEALIRAHTGRNNGTLLHNAVLINDASLIRQLLAGFTPEVKSELVGLRNNKGATALHVAARNGHTEAIDALLEGLTAEQQQVRLADRAKGFTPLHVGAKNRDHERAKAAVDTLDKYGPNYNVRREVGFFANILALGKPATPADLAGKKRGNYELAHELQGRKNQAQGKEIPNRWQKHLNTEQSSESRKGR